jgi:hypothetical protein
MGAWNADAATCWNRLRTGLARESGGLRFFRAAEVQKRGLLHYHVIVKWAKPVPLHRIHALATDAGFGCVIDLRPIDPGSTWSQHYVSKYVTKSCDDRDEVRWERLDYARVDRETGEIPITTTPTFRTWSCSRDWGLTMAEIVAAARRAAVLRPEAAESLGEDVPGDDGWGLAAGASAAGP